MTDPIPEKIMHPLTASSTAPTTTGAEHSAAIDALTAAKLRREFARDGSSVFVHAPREASSVNAALCRSYFGPDMQVEHPGQSTLITVARRFGEDTAELLFSINGWPSRIDLDAAELFALAKRFIDAAHDLTAKPAQQQGGAA